MFGWSWLVGLACGRGCWAVVKVLVLGVGGVVVGGKGRRGKVLVLLGLGVGKVVVMGEGG